MVLNFGWHRTSFGSGIFGSGFRDVRLLLVQRSLPRLYFRFSRLSLAHLAILGEIRKHQGQPK